MSPAELARFLDDLDAVRTPIARIVLERHSRREVGGIAYCDGCDPGDYAESAAEWPCSTVELIAKYHGIAVPTT